MCRTNRSYKVNCLLLVNSVYSFYMNQVMTCRPRSDLYVNLPALRKLDNMLLVSSCGCIIYNFGMNFKEVGQWVILNFGLLTGNTWKFCQYRVLVCRPGCSSPKCRWWFIFFSTSNSASGGKMVASCTPSPSLWPPWKFKKESAAQARLHQPNT